MKKVAYCLVALTLITGRAYSLDKKMLETHIRKAFNLNSTVPITIGDSEPSDFAGLTTVKVVVAGNDVPIYLTPDEKKYFWGRVFDMTVDPDKERESKIQLKNAHYKGSAKAPVTLVEYSDLQCSHCQKAYMVISSDLYKTYSKDKVRLVFKHFPLGMHKWAETGAVATECAGQQSNDAFWKMTDLFFAAAEEITEENVKQKAVQFATEAKLNKSKFNTCFDSNATLARVRADKEEGTSIGINATPTFVINGRMVKGDSFNDLKVVIDDKLAEGKGQ